MNATAMSAAMLRRQLEGSLVLDEFDCQRTYLGMSRIGECPRRLYNELVYGRKQAGPVTRRYCHEGYLHEKDIIERLNKAGLIVDNCGRELVAPFDERFRGHIDGELDSGTLLEIKSVSPHKFNEVRSTHMLLSQHTAQVQMYMRYGHYRCAYVIYKCRDDGQIFIVVVDINERAGERLEQKARHILQAIDAGESPACQCGECP